MTTLLEAMRQRVPVLAARLDARVAEDAQHLRSAAATQRTKAVRHHEAVAALHQEATLGEEMRTAAPAHHARETAERPATVTPQRGGPPPTSRAGACPSPGTSPRLPPTPIPGHHDRGPRPLAR